MTEIVDPILLTWEIVMYMTYVVFCICIISIIIHFIHTPGEN